MSAPSRIQWFVAGVAAVSLPGCFFPTLQTATVRNGVSVGAAYLSDQIRADRAGPNQPQGPDILVFGTISGRAGTRVPIELALRAGWYTDRNSSATITTSCDASGCVTTVRRVTAQSVVVAPQLKLASPQSHRTKAAMVLGLDGVAVIGSCDTGPLEPYVAVKRMFTLGGWDTDLVPRYQGPRQTIWTAAIGAEGRRLGVEAGVLRNQYGGGQPLHDLYLAGRAFP